MAANKSDDSMLAYNPSNIYLLEVNNGKSKRGEICSKLTTKTPEPA